jgi:hypothetical protein
MSYPLNFDMSTDTADVVLALLAEVARMRELTDTEHAVQMVALAILRNEESTHQQSNE